MEATKTKTRPRRVLQAAAHPSLPAPKLSPTIQNLRALFRLLNEEEFESECLMERKRRDSEKKKQIPPPPSAKEHSNNKKRAAAPPTDDAAITQGGDDSNTASVSSRKRKKNAVPTTRTITATLPFSPPPPSPLPFEPTLEFHMQPTTTVRATEIGRTEGDTAVTAATTVATADPTAATAAAAASASAADQDLHGQDDLLESLVKHRPRQSWDDTYQSLVAFKQLYGHVLVPSQDASFKYLWRWCENQRNHWKWFLQGKKSDLNQQRVDRLIEIGMGTREDGPTDLNATAWETKFQLVLQFQKTHGHCNIPRNRNNNNNNTEFYDLGMWVERQRKAFKNRQHKAATGQANKRHGGAGYMTDEQMMKLASIPGFRFTNKQVDYQTRILQLSQYKNMHVHA